MVGAVQGVSAAAVAAALLAAATGDRASAQATASDDAQARGVIVLRPTPTPSAVPTPPAAPPPATVAAPQPAPTTQPVTVAAPAVRPPAPVAPPPACARPFARPTMTLSTANGFDARLTAALRRTSAPVVVNLSRPFALGAVPPAALQPWITEVKATGGLVTVDQYCEGARGFFSFLKKMFSGQKASRYAAADGYDAVLHADGRDQIVTQVEFRRRAAK